MRLTVAICTWNRAELLARTLHRLTELEVPSDIEWELVVVDNNCTDHTTSVLESFRARLPVIGVVEPQPGLSHARNRAIAVGSGDFIIWTDDDVFVDRGWLTAYCHAFNSHPRAAFFGGPVEPWFEGDAPAWLLRTFDQVSSAFAVRNLSNDSFRLTDEPGRLPFGANYAIRRDMQERHPYAAHLGRRPGSMVGHEEIAVMLELLAEGAEGWWVPNARVRHFIPRERQTVQYLRRYFEGQGEIAARQRVKVGRFTWWGRPGWMWKEVVASELRYRIRRLLREPRDWIPALKHAAFVRGRLRGYRPLNPAGE